MGLTLTTVVDGTSLTAAAVEDYVAKIERYLNEEVVSADLDTAAWVDSVHIFKPEFYGSPYPRTKLVSGMAHYYRKTDNIYTVAAFNYRLGRESFVHVPGLQASLKIPDNSTRVNVTASFAAFEWGGSDTVDEGSTLTPSSVVANFYLYQDETQLGYTGRRLYPSGATPTTEAETVLGALVARKQICMSDSLSFNAGTRTCGVRVGVQLPTTTGALADWKHVFVLQRNFVVDYHLR
jgi:hypothetical protein